VVGIYHAAAAAVLQCSTGDMPQLNGPGRMARPSKVLPLATVRRLPYNCSVLRIDLLPFRRRTLFLLRPVFCAAVTFFRSNTILHIPD